MSPLETLAVIELARLAAHVDAILCEILDGLRVAVDWGATGAFDYGLLEARRANWRLGLILQWRRLLFHPDEHLPGNVRCVQHPEADASGSPNS